MTYQDYLCSQQWDILRRQRLEIDRFECVLCGRLADEVHHRRYPKVYGDETVMDLVSLCSRCHSAFHCVNDGAIRLPPRTPLTDGLKSLKQQLGAAAARGDEEAEKELLSYYINARRAQVVGA